MRTTSSPESTPLPSSSKRAWPGSGLGLGLGIGLGIGLVLVEARHQLLDCEVLAQPRLTEHRLELAWCGAQARARVRGEGQGYCQGQGSG